MVVTPSSGLGGPVTFIATIDGTGISPIGTVTFTSNPNVGGCAAVPVAGSGADDAVATCEITVAPGQNVTVTANYSGSGDGTYDPTSANVDYNAVKATPAVTVSPTTGPSGPVTFTATIEGTGTRPTGTVTFTTAPDVGGCAAVPVAASGADDATATCLITVAPGQGVTVNAAYSGDAGYNPAAGNGDYQPVQITPTVTVTPTTGSAGPVTFTATIDGTGTSPTGTVTFTTSPAVGGCTGVPVAASGADDATATCAITLAPGQTVTVNAAYTGDATYNSATGNTDFLTLLVPVVTVTPDGQGPAGTVTFTVRVTGAGADPTGTVDVTASAGLGGCTALTLIRGTSGSTATCSLSIPPDASVLVTATYSGDTNYEAGVQGQAGYQTPTATVAVAVVASVPPGAPAGTTSFTATVTSSDGGTPTGTVTITVQTGLFSGPQSCVAPLQPGPGPGQASGTCPLAVDPNQTFSVAAVYNGSGHYFAGTGQVTNALRATPVVSLTADVSSPVAAGTPVTFTATVTGDAGGANPTGTVRFEVAGMPVTGCESVPVVAGTARCTVTLPPGSHRIVAGYSGDAGYLPGSAEIGEYLVGEALALTGSAENLARTGAGVDSLLLAALLLILAGGRTAAFGATRRGPRRGSCGS
ncbi:MAG TPA: Ig-like domain repeat protein [Actinophytocola sp.]|uniref:Ig-like domain repeat protein n=1 Tax=Actinophytocola sp. TaxID=1872138 RepID=UPI002DBAE6B3|nr:Ig-like domain repeat protein [Actinophytocola sp.]HEU5474190.1 Ig-like domain repeat protein [Actinophytocola sp.]